MSRGFPPDPQGLGAGAPKREYWESNGKSRSQVSIFSVTQLTHLSESPSRSFKSIAKFEDLNLIDISILHVKLEVSAKLTCCSISLTLNSCPDRAV